ncbi:MAG: M14 family metallopeptidase [Clostridiales bacterium]|nr:M14 family metallopeptidase [Clostridiales bacterium]
MKISLTARSVILTLFFFLWGSLSPQATAAQSSQTVLTPAEHFGFKPGADRMLFTYEELISYLQKLDAASPRLKMIEIGKSQLGKPMYIAFITSEENINRLERLKEVNRTLALDPSLTESGRAALLDDGKVFVLAALSMHADEVGPAQAAPLIAHELVTTQDPQITKWLDDTVYMMIPTHNPDGMDMVVEHYRKYKGTKYEGSAMPGVYHKYIGHDNNRDYVTLSQEDTRAIARIYNLEWFPQVLVDKHQMWTTGPRYFVPPVHDPISENVDAGIWNWTKVFGSHMITDMTEAGLAGVCHSYIFDDYWPGSTQTCIWKNVIGMLTELASVKDATPVFVEPNELAVYGKGLSEYKMSINMPSPWPGGWWRLADMVEYEIASTMSMLKTASLYRRQILEFQNDLCRREVKRGTTLPPFYYVLPQAQRDQGELVGLVNLLREHGVRVYRLSKAAALEGKNFQAGDFVVPLAQPFRPFIKEVMEKQEYPVRRYTPGGEVIKPYDITTWSLPLHRGVKSHEINTRSDDFESLLLEVNQDFTLKKDIPAGFWAAILSVNNNESFKAAFQALKLGLKVERLDKQENLAGESIPKGSFLFRHDPRLKPILEALTVGPVILTEPSDLKSTPLRLPRIALVETYFHDMDAGWTRFVLDSYSIPFTVLRPGDFEKTDLAKSFDTVIFPDAEKSILMEGKYKVRDEYQVADYPPEYTKGIGKTGMEKLMAFLDSGGTIISWGGSTPLFIGKLEIARGKEDKEEFQLPVQDISESLQKSGLYCPSALMKTLLLEDHPLTLGLPREIGVVFNGNPVFTTSVPIFDMDRRVIGKFPEKNILMSGYCEKQETLADKTNLVWLKKGKGQVVLFAFSPIFRASIQAAYKLLFNALLLQKIG